MPLTPLERDLILKEFQTCPTPKKIVQLSKLMEIKNAEGTIYGQPEDFLCLTDKGKLFFLDSKSFEEMCREVTDANTSS